MPKDFWSRSRDQILQWQIANAETRRLFDNLDKRCPSIANLSESKIVDLISRQFDTFDKSMVFFSQFQNPFGNICIVLLGEQTFKSLMRQPVSQRALSFAELCANSRGATAELAAWALASVLTPQINKSVLRHTRNLTPQSPWFQTVTACNGDRILAVRALLERRSTSQDDLLPGIEVLTLQLQKTLTALDQLQGKSNSLSLSRDKSDQPAQPRSSNIPGAQVVHSRAADQAGRSIQSASPKGGSTLDRNPQPRLKVFSEIEEFIGDFGTIARQYLGRETVKQLVRLRRRQRAMRLVQILKSPIPEVRDVALLSLMSIYSPEIHALVCREVQRIPQQPEWFVPLRDYRGDLNTLLRAILKALTIQNRRHSTSMKMVIQDLEALLRATRLPAGSRTPGRPR